MTWAIISDIENIPAEIKSWLDTSPTVQTIETDAKSIGASTWAYIKANGGQALYNIALSILTGAATGTSWAALGASLVSQAEQAGITIAKGAEGVILAQAQADLVSQGAIASPTSGAVVPNPVTSVPTAS